MTDDELEAASAIAEATRTSALNSIAVRAALVTFEELNK